MRRTRTSCCWTSSPKFLPDLRMSPKDLVFRRNRAPHLERAYFLECKHPKACPSEPCYCAGDSGFPFVRWPAASYPPASPHMLEKPVQSCVFRVAHIDEWQRHMVYDIYHTRCVETCGEGLILLARTSSPERTSVPPFRSVCYESHAGTVHSLSLSLAPRSLSSCLPLYHFAFIL